MIILGMALATSGVGILLGGAASMQKACGDTALDSTIASFGGGSVGYLAPVECSHLFQYTWWIVYLHWFVWVLTLVVVLMNVVHKARIALVGLLAVASVLLMDTANTYLMLKYSPDMTGKMKSTTSTTITGAILSAIADLFLILVIGWDSFAPERQEHYSAGATSVSATTTTAAGTAPV